VKLLFVDTETTGLPKKWGRPATEVDNWPRVIELGAISVDTESKKVQPIGLLVCPNGFEIPAEATATHGITTEMASEGDPAEWVFPELHKLMTEADYVVGHNVKFDMDCIGAEYARQELPQLFPLTICTMMGTRHMFGKWPKLAELYRKVFAQDFQDAHRALADITATARCFWRLVEAGLWTELGIAPELAGEILEIVSRETITETQGGEDLPGEAG
jgi:DNA polymerase III epsilon subunit-like protein